MRREFLSTFLRTMRCLTGKFFVIQRSLFEDSGRQIVLISPAFVVVGSVHAFVIWCLICFSSFRKSRLQKISDFWPEPLAPLLVVSRCGGPPGVSTSLARIGTEQQVEGLSTRKCSDVGLNFNRTQFSTVPGRGTQTDEQHECRAQRDAVSCVCRLRGCQNFVPKEISRHVKCRSSNA